MTYRIEYNEKKYCFKRGNDRSYKPPYNVYCVKVENDNNLSLILEIDRDFVNGEGSRNIGKFLINTEKNCDFNYEELVKQIKLLFLIYLSGNKNSIYISKGLISKIISELKLIYSYNDYNDFYIDEWTEKQLINITKGMFRNLDGSYSLNGISDKFKSHPSRISKFYGKLFGFGFSDVYHFAQMKKSIEYIYSDKKDKNIFLNKKFNIKLNRLYGKYKVIIKKFCIKDGTFYNEWKKMGAPDYLGDEEKEYLEAKVRPTLQIENIELFGKFEKNIELDLCEIAFIEMKKLYI